VASLLVMLVAWLAGANALASAAATVWLCITSALCVHRLRGTSRKPSHVAEMILTSALIPPLAVFWRLAGAIRFRVRFA
jgi:hypothetical protein